MDRFPTPQGSNSQTFKPGALDGSLIVPQLIDLQYHQSPDHPVFVYDDIDGHIMTIRFSQYVPAVHQAAKYVLKHIAHLGFVVNESKPIVVGLLGGTDSITYCMMVNAICRAGLVPFAISPRSSAAGLEHLLRITRTACVFVTEGPMKDLLSAALHIMSISSGKSIPTVAFPRFEQFQGPLDNAGMLSPMVTPALDTIAVILHSSGSTSEFSKPIRLSHKTYLQWAVLPCYGELDLCGDIMACQSIPMFHGMGISITSWPASIGLTISVLRPAHPPIVPAPDIVLKSVVATRSSLLFCVPTFVEVWSKTVEGLEMLKAMKVVSFGGAPLNKHIGDVLVANGVVLTQFYGAIETGCLTPYLPSKSYGKDWEYFRFSEHCTPIVTLHDDMPNVYELILVDGPSHTPCFINTAVNGKPAYKLNDLLERHPEIPTMYKVFGRTDDQIALSNGLNVNPGPMESAIVKHPRVAFAIIFGGGRTHTGVLLELRKEFQFNPQNVVKLKEFRDSIWPTIDNLNRIYPTHYKVVQEMLVVASPTKPFELNGKLQPRRAVVLQAYQQEINAAYEGVQLYSELQATV